MHNIGVPGLASGPPLPDNLNAVIRKISSQPGPSGRGRIRLPALPPSFVAGNDVTTTAATAYNALIAAWKTAVVDQGLTFTPAIFSAKDRAFYVIGDMQFDARVFTDRRRTSRI